MDELKEEIKSKKGYEINRQRLIFHGKVLKPKQNLQDYCMFIHVTNNSSFNPPHAFCYVCLFIILKNKNNKIISN